MGFYTSNFSDTCTTNKDNYIPQVIDTLTVYLWLNSTC